MLKNGFSGSVVLILNVFINIVCAVARVFIVKKIINMNLKQYLRLVVIPLIKLTIAIIPFFLLLNYYNSESLASVVVTSVLSILYICFATYFLCLDSEEKNFIKRLPIVTKLNNS